MKTTVYGNDYTYEGTVVSVFKKRKSGEIRCVVEDADGRLFIHNGLQVPEVTLMPFDPVADLEEFHAKFDQFYEGPARALTGELRKFREGFLSEELDEYKLAAAAAVDILTAPVEARDAADYAFQLDKAMDSLIDLAYIVFGTAHLHGFNMREGWRRVHEANMKKVRRLSAESHGHAFHDSGRLPTYDIVKPEGWTPPTHIDLVEVNDVREPHEELA